MANHLITHLLLALVLLHVTGNWWWEVAGWLIVATLVVTWILEIVNWHLKRKLRKLEKEWM